MPAYPTRGDYFDRARTVAVALLLCAAVVAVTGSVLDWVTISVQPTLDPEADFEAPVEPLRIREPYNGIEANDGWYVVGAGAVVVVAAAGLAITRRRGFAWLGFLAAMVIGAIAFAAYRGVGDLSSSISRRMEIVGDPDPGIGITLVAVGGIVALVASVLGLIATPRVRD
jgi:hypothetical protein